MHAKKRKDLVRNLNIGLVDYIARGIKNYGI
jgi:hypothetical protein